MARPSKPTPQANPQPAPPQQSTSAELTTRTLRRVRVVVNAVKSHFRQVEKQAGIGGAQLWALSLIAADPGLRVGQLAATMDIHQTTASNLVRGLLKAQLVESVRDGKDRRTVRLSVSSSGQAVLRKAPGPFAGVLPDALARLDTHTLERLEQDLAKLIRILQADHRAASLPLAHL